MDLDLLRKGLDYTRKKKTWILLLGALGFSGYGAYKVYNLPSVAKKRERWSKLLGALFAVAEMVSNSAEAIGAVSKDLKEFIQSDSDQIPNSLKQISKITRSDEMSASLVKITSAVTLGILLGSRQETQKVGGSLTTKESDFSDRVLDKLFTEVGTGFASVIVGSFARNLVLAYYSNKQSNVEESKLLTDSFPTWADVLFEDKCRELIGDCVQMFVSTAVAVFLDKTMHVNTYDELFSGMTNPKHEARVKDMLSSICNGAAETVVKSAYQVSANSGGDTTPASKFLPSEFARHPRRGDRPLIQRKWMSIGSRASKLLPYGNNQDNSGWMRKMSSTLAVPSNRKFVLDVTGRVTSETVQSFLEFLLQKMPECTRSSIDVIQEEVFDRGAEVMQHVSMKSSAVVSICLSLCLHVLNSPWILVLA